MIEFVYYDTWLDIDDENDVCPAAFKLSLVCWVSCVRYCVCAAVNTPLLIALGCCDNCIVGKPNTVCCCCCGCCWGCCIKLCCCNADISDNFGNSYKLYQISITRIGNRVYRIYSVSYNYCIIFSLYISF